MRAEEKIDGLFTIREGNPLGEKIVFLHGLMGASQNWAAIAKSFLDDYEVLRIDQRGHGKSHHRPGRYDLAEYAEDLKNLLDFFGWKTIHLVGHSMGGRNAIQFSGLFPERLSSLFIEDIGVRVEPSSSLETEKKIRSVPVPFKDRKQARHFFDGEFLDLFGKDPSAAKRLGAFFYANLREREDGLMDWRVYREGVLLSLAEARKTDLSSLWEALDLPLTLMRGEHSNDLSSSQFSEMLSLNSRVVGVEIEGSGHWVHSEKPKEFTNELQAHLLRAQRG